ncbi:MAG: hypothetical protein AAFV72_09445 [Cyanobacteria bacterium J06635_1]
MATVSNFLTGKPVDRATFLELCDKLSLDSDEIADLGLDPENLRPQNLAPSVPKALSSPASLPLSNQDWGKAMDVGG